MAVIGVPTINAPGVPVDLSRALPARDPALVGVTNDGVRFMADAAFPWCYPGGSPTGRPDAGNPTNGAVIYDMAERANGSFALPASGTTYAGGGFDFTNSTALTGSRNVGIIMPASVLADLWADYGGQSQRFLFSMWVKLPTLANWNSSASLLSIAGDLPLTSDPSLFIITQRTGGFLDVRRQVAAGVSDTGNPLVITPASGDYGSVVQLSVWRTATQQGFRLRSANGTIMVTRAAGASNTQNFSANPFCVGRNGASYAGASPTTTLAAMSGFRVYRTMMENLARSGRDPIAVQDAAYTAVTARGVFS